MSDKLWLTILDSLYCIPITKSHEYQARTVNVLTVALRLHKTATQNKTEREKHSNSINRKAELYLHFSAALSLESVQKVCVCVCLCLSAREKSTLSPKKRGESWISNALMCEDGAQVSTQQEGKLFF